MFIVRMQGGLGNQIFIYFFYRSLCLKYGEENVSIDITSYNRFHAHTGYELENVFSVKSPDKCKIKEARKLSPEIIYSRRMGLICNKYRLIRKLVDFYNTFIAKQFKKNKFHREASLYGFDGGVYRYSLKDDVYFSGYWQNTSYFKEIDICKELVFGKEYTMSEKESFLYDKNAFIHIRGGDYLTTDSLSLCKKDYYLKAIDHMNKFCPDSRYMVFTDDVEYAESILKSLNLQYEIYKSEQGNPAMDLKEMSLYRFGIISNSTFSFWGAVLTRNKIICTPKYWYEEDGKKYMGPALEGWELIENG